MPGPSDMERVLRINPKSSREMLTNTNTMGYADLCITTSRTGMTLGRRGITTTDTGMTLSRTGARRYDTDLGQIAQTQVTKKENIDKNA